MDEETLDRGLSRRTFLTRTGASATGLFLASAGVPLGALASRTRGAQSLSSLTWAMEQKINVLDLSKPASIAAIEALGAFLEGPLRLDNQGVPRAHLATLARPDPLTYVLKVRRGVRFWNGDPMTAADLAFSIQRHIDPEWASAMAFFYASVKSIDVTGSDEVTLKLKNPDPTLIFVLAIAPSFVVQEKVAKAHAKDHGTPDVLPRGTGPFKLVSFTPGDNIQLERNELYWGRKPAIAKLRLNMIEDASTRLLALRTNQIQGTFDPPIEQLSAWQRSAGATLKSAPGTKLFVIGFNMAKPPFDDVHVRRAVAHALDRDGIINGLLHGRARAALAAPPPEQWAGLLKPAEVLSMYASLPRQRFNLGLAERELKQSKVPNGFSTTVYSSAATPALGSILLNLKQNLAKIGIKLTVREVPGQTAKERFLAHSDGIVIFALGADYPDPIDNMVWLLPSEYAKPGTYNVANYKSAKVDNLIAQQARQQGARRTQTLKQLFRQLAVDVPYLPIVWIDATVAVRRGLDFNGFNSWTWLQSAWPNAVVSA